MADEIIFKLFSKSRSKTEMDDEIEECYFSVLDVVGILSESKNPSQYWRTLNDEGRKVLQFVTY